MKLTIASSRNLCFAILAFGMLHSHAATLFIEDFESLNVGNSVSGGNSGNLPIKNSRNSTVRDESLSTALGTPNQFVEISDDQTGAGWLLMSAAYVETYDAVTTFQFDFYEPTVTGRASSFNFGFGDAELTSGARRARASFDGGMLGDASYSADTAYRVYMIMNDSSSAEVYSGGTLAAGTADVWLENLGGGSPIKAATISLENSSDVAGYNVGFRTFNGTIGDFYVDNVTLFEGAATVPEPAAALFGLAGCVLLLRRRRHR